MSNKSTDPVSICEHCFVPAGGQYCVKCGLHFDKAYPRSETVGDFVDEWGDALDEYYEGDGLGIWRHNT